MVYGSIHYDVIAQYQRFPQENDRLFPSVFTLAPGGMGGNVSAIFARLGGRCRFIGTFSNDADGDELRRDLERDGVDTSWTRVHQESGTRGLIMVDEHGERAIIGYYSEMFTSLIRSAGQAPASIIATATYLRKWEQSNIGIPVGVFDDIVAGFYCPMNYAPKLLPQIPDNVPVFIDAEGIHLEHIGLEAARKAISRASVLFANHRSFATLREFVGVGFLAHVKKFSGATLVETLGKRGCRIHTSQEVLYVPGFPVKAIDSTGAGDSFAASFLFSHLSGASVRESGEMACRIASLSVQMLGSRPGVPSTVASGTPVHTERY